MNCWEKEILYFESSKFFEELYDSIRKAKVSIDVETYIFGDDLIGQKIFDLLSEKASKGVRVRLIVDGVGSWDWINSKADVVTNPQFEIKVYHPLPWPFLNWKMTMRKNLFRMVEFFSKMNRRNHQKLIVIDQEVVFLGSLNLHQESVSWCELGVQLKGIDPDLFNELFDATWSEGESFAQVVHGGKLRGVRGKRAKNPRNRKNNNFDPGTSQVRSNQTRKNRQKIYKDLSRRILAAKEKVLIVTPYFVPPKRIMDCLCRVAQSGVKVILLTAGPTDVRVLKIIRPIYFRQMLRSGVRVFEFEDKILHAKFLGIDDFYLMGSSNLNHRSLMHDLEIDIVIKERETRVMLEEVFSSYFEQSRELKIEQMRFYNIFHWGLAKILLQLKNYL